MMFSSAVMISSFSTRDFLKLSRRSKDLVGGLKAKTKCLGRPVAGFAVSHRIGLLFLARLPVWAEVIVGVDPDPLNNPRLIQWAKDYWLALHPFSSGGGYINMMMDEGEANVKAAYRDNYTGLVQVKRKYDPNNLFRVNQNIKPA